MSKERKALKLALEYLRDNQHYIADNERHAYVMEYNAFVERLEALADQPNITKYLEKDNSEQPAQQQNLQDLWHKVWPDAGAFVRASADDLTQFAKAISTFPQPAQQQEPVAQKPYAYEYGVDNGDGTYSVHIDRGSLIHTGVQYEYCAPRNPHRDHPVTPLYTSPPASKPLTDEQKDAARYRWLRDNNVSFTWIPSRYNEKTVSGFSAFGTGYLGFEFEAAVDLAIEAAHVKGDA